MALTLYVPVSIDEAGETKHDGAVDAPVPIFLRPAYRRALAARAAALRMGEPEVAARMLANALDPFLEQGPDDEQARAERQLLALIDVLVAGEMAAKTWNEHLTGAVFEKIAAEHLKLYSAATALEQRNRVNRLIGGRVKALANADAKLNGAKPIVAQFPRSTASLVRRYTLLVPKT